MEPMPDILVALTQRLVRWGVLPRARAPDSAIINIYDEVRGPRLPWQPYQRTSHPVLPAAYFHTFPARTGMHLPCMPVLI